MIKIRRLNVKFGTQTALQDVDLDFTRGSFTGIVGPSGCGKSTLLRCIASLHQATEGELSISSEAADDIAFVFQSPSLLPWRDVLQNVELPLELRGKSKSDSRGLAEDVCALVGLHEQDWKKFPKMLSGGMRMRVSLARAFITQPKILLLDEPFAALDDILRHELNGELLRLWSEQKWAALFVTHNVSEAVFLSERIVVLTKNPGRVAAVIDVPFDYPRSGELRATPEFAKLCGEVSSCLLEASQ